MLSLLFHQFAFLIKCHHHTLHAAKTLCLYVFSLWDHFYEIDTTGENTNKSLSELKRFY